MTFSDWTSSWTLRRDISLLWPLFDACFQRVAMVLWSLTIALFIQATEALALYHNEVR